MVYSGAACTAPCVVAGAACIAAAAAGALVVFCAFAIVVIYPFVCKQAPCLPYKLNIWYLGANVNGANANKLK